ncbi:MAG: hypothetical protein IMZ58_08415, partial [Thermoplasmata archaeon]|nr:hypothetical protein [Thermoplasmata archaeon]
SKVVDDNGEPLVVYHGTKTKFTEFKDMGYTKGFFFSPDIRRASPFANRSSNIMDVYLNVKNPLILGRGKKFTTDEIINPEKHGYDGIFKYDDFGKLSTIIVYKPTQIKSATGNRGTFDPENPDIRFMRTEDTTPEEEAEYQEYLKKSRVSKVLGKKQVEAAAAFEKKPPKYTEAEYSAPIAPEAENVKPVEMVQDIQGDKTLTQKLDFMQASQKTGNHISWNPSGKKNNLDFLNKAEQFYTDWKELAFPIQKVQDIAQKENIPIADAENIDYAIDQVRGSPAAAKQWIDDKIKPIFDAIPSKINGKKASRGAVYAESVKYMVAKRSKDLYENEDKGYVDGGYDKTTADKMVDFVEIGAHPWAKEIQRIADEMWNVTKELLQIKLDAGIIDDELFYALTEEHYVPFYRDIEKGSKGPRSGGGDKFTATSKGIMRIKGSLKGSPIIDPVQGVIQQVYETIQNVARAKVANTLVDLAERSEAVGELVKELPPKWIKAGTIEHRGAVDMVLRPQIEAMAEELGIKVEYTAKLAGRIGGRMSKLLGMFSEDRIKALVGATEGTVAHELGHGIHRSGKYGWLEGIAERNSTEMNLIADSRYQGEEVPVKFVTYVRSTKEKIAEFISMYLTDRAMLMEMAPNSIAELEAKIKDDPVLSKMIEMKPSNVAGIHSIEVANFVRDRSIPRDEDVISVLRGGHIKSYRVPMEVAVAIKNLNPSMFPMWFRVLMLPTKIVRAGAVGLNIDFMIPNVFRDQMDAAINAKTIPGIDWFLGFKSYVSHDDYYRQYNLMGGGMESSEAGIGGGKAKASELQYGGKSFMDPYYWQTHGVFHGLTQASWYAFKTPFRALYGLAEISEMSSRLGTFRRARKGLPLGIKLRGGGAMSLEAAIHVARQATLDFQRFGRYGKGANEIIPFINAGFEGIDKMVRTFKDDPKRAILKSMVYAMLPMIGFYLWNRKDERYKAVPLKDKILNWIIMKEDGGYWKIPKGHITKWVINPIQIPLEIAMGDIIDDNKPMVVYKVARDLSPVDYNSLIPPVIKLIVEPIANYDLYWQTEIEKPSIKAIPIPGLRWDARTSGALKYIGKSLNISPIMMQHELETLGAGFTKNVLWVADVASLKTTKEEMKIQSIPVVRRFAGQLNEWNTDIDRNIREINKQLSEMNELSMRKMIRSYGHKPKDIQELRKRNSEFRYKLERKRYELTKAKDEIKYLLSKEK